MFGKFFIKLLAISIVSTLFLVSAQGYDLEGWQETVVKCNGISIHYIRSGGDKPVLIMAHGLGGGCYRWMPLANSLKVKFDIISYDARGHGKSSHTQGAYTLENQVQDLFGLIKVLEIKKPILLGHSMGSFTCCVFAAKYPEIPKAVLLEDPSIGTPHPENQAAFSEYKKHVDSVKEFFHAIPNKKFDPDAISILDNLMQHLVEGHSLDTYFPKIPCPVLILKAGKNMAEEKQNKQLKLANKLTHGKLIYIKDAGHMVLEEQFEPYKNGVIQFLSSLPLKK